MTQASEQAVNGPCLGDLLEIPVATLRPVDAAGFDLYLVNGAAAKPKLYRGRDYPIEQSDIERLGAAGIQTLYLSRSDRARYDRYLRSHLDELLADETIVPSVRYHTLLHCARSQVQEAVSTLNMDRAVDLSHDVGQHVVQLICTSDFLPGHLLRLARHDASTFSHLINVATYCVALAKQFGISGRKDLESLATGALLHDIGKRSIPTTILNKPGSLTSAEKRVVQRHPQIGFEELAFHRDLQWGQLMMVYQHHESVDGSGYPVHVTEREIHYQARLCAVVDVFDALTCDRPYRRRLQTRDALELLESQSGKKFDKEMVRCWNETARTSKKSAW